MAVQTLTRRRLEDYPFSAFAIQRVAPIANFVAAGQIAAAQVALGRLALGVCRDVRANRFSPRDADDLFLLLFLYLGEEFPDVDLGEVADELVFEGMLLHDYGTKFGADLDLMEALARQLLDGQ